MRISKSNQKKTLFVIALLTNPEHFAPAYLQKLLQRIAVQPAVHWISLSRNNDVFLHSVCPGANWLVEEFKNGIVVERFEPPFPQKGYFFEYVGTVMGRTGGRLDKPCLVTLPVKYFSFILNEQTRAAAAAKERRDKAAMQAGEALMQISGVTSSDAWI